MKIDVALQRALLCLCLTFALAPFPGRAQSPRTTVTGVVRAGNGDPLANVTVTVKNVHTNFSAGTATDSVGLFRFAGLEAGNGYEFTFSSIGFETQTVSNNTLKAGSVFSMAIRLNETQKALSEVIVVGYGTQARTSTTAAVSVVKGSELAESPVPNITQSLAGKVSGIVARPNGGVPGQDDPDIHIRGVATTGNSGALIVIDGIIRNNINEIDPNSIESVSILKDAAAVAPYGVGGANGVVLITTKRGKVGIANLSVNAYYGFQRPTFPPKMLNAKDYMTLKNEGDANSGLQPDYSQDIINNYDQLHKQNPNLYPNSDAQKELINLNTPIQNYNVQLQGGSDKIQYYVGLSYLGQQGNAAPLNYNRYSYNVALDISATSTTKVSVSLSGAQEQNQIYPFIAGSFLSWVPLNAVYFTNGLWGQNGGYSPVGELHSGSYDRVNRSTLLTSLGVEQQLPFVRGLSIKGVFSYDPTSRTEKVWNRPVYYYIYDTANNPATYDKTLLSDGFTTLSDTSSSSQTFTYQGFLNYKRTFGEHSISALVVAEARNFKQDTFFASRKGFNVDVDELSLGTSDRSNFNNGGSGATGSQVGYVYRLDYGYAGKYLFEATGRYDGHYYFAPGHQYAYFPAFSAGWRLSEESFIKDHFDWINNLKLRGSWGKSGNLAGGPFQYLSQYTLEGNAYLFGNGSLVQGSYVPLEANPNITWEKSSKTDVGLEGTLWKGLLSFEADYFYEKRSDMLVSPNITVPVEYGLGLAQENAGVMSNHGYELTLGTQHSFRNGLQLALNGNFSYAKNKLLQVFETAATRNNPNRSRTGRPYGTPFGYKALGLFKTSDDKNGDGIIDGSDGYAVTQFGTLHPGDVKYADLNHDGKIDANDETAVGYPVTPQITYGFTATAAWKGFDLSLFFQGAAEASINIQGYQTVPFRLNNTSTSYEYFDNRWTPTHQDARYPKAYASKSTNNTTNPLNGDGFGAFSSSIWMMNTGFMRLKTAVLGYTIPSRITRQAGMKGVRLYVTGQNLFTVSKLRFEDPETGYTNREEAYPIQKSIIFGANVNF
jgi:TonB-linked SusC/RagA family outer membrane protein